MGKHSNKKNNTKAKETWKKIGKGTLKALKVVHVDIPLFIGKEIIVPAATAAATTILTGQVENAIANSKSKKIEHKDNE